MTPLLITAQMMEPVVYYGDGMHFDGILAYGAYMAMSREERDVLPPISQPWALDMDLPLGRWEHDCLIPDGADSRLTTDGKLERHDDHTMIGRVWGWKASAVVPIGETIEGLHELRKKPELGQMSRFTDSKSHHVGMGPMRAKDMKYPKLFAKTLKWYAVGDAPAVRDLLERVHAIGKLTKQGPGRVMEWRVEETDQDLSMRGNDGRPTRRLPSMMYPADYPSGIGSIRPPYHHPSRRVWAVEPER